MTGLGNCEEEGCSDGIWCTDKTHRMCREELCIDNAFFSCNKPRFHKKKHQAQGDFPARFTLKWKFL